ncbi:MAG: sulfatase-like hydrolase/transferase [Myxococcales bacterium]
MFYTTDAYAERAVDWLDKNHEKPWFLYLPFNAQHAPLQAPKKYLDRFPNITEEKRKCFAAMMSGMDDADWTSDRLKFANTSKKITRSSIFIGDNGGPTQQHNFGERRPSRFQNDDVSKEGLACPFFVLSGKATFPSGQKL